MVVLNIDVKVPGEQVGRKIGNPTNAEADSDSKSAEPGPQQQSNRN